MLGSIHISKQTPVAYYPVNGFTTVDLGCSKGNALFTLITKQEYPQSEAFLNMLLTCFSPISKEKNLINSNDTHVIDILIAMDCISEGQNLQDCDYLINYDIHW